MMWEGSGRALSGLNWVDGQGSSSEDQNGCEEGTERQAKALVHQYGEPATSKARRQPSERLPPHPYRTVVPTLL